MQNIIRHTKREVVYDSEWSDWIFDQSHNNISTRCYHLVDNTYEISDYFERYFTLEKVIVPLLTGIMAGLGTMFNSGLIAAIGAFLGYKLAIKIKQRYYRANTNSVLIDTKIIPNSNGCETRIKL